MFLPIGILDRLAFFEIAFSTKRVCERISHPPTTIAIVVHSSFHVVRFLIRLLES